VIITWRHLFDIYLIDKIYYTNDIHIYY